MAVAVLSLPLRISAGVIPKDLPTIEALIALHKAVKKDEDKAMQRVAASFGEQSLLTKGAGKFNDVRTTLNTKLDNAHSYLVLAGAISATANALYQLVKEYKNFTSNTFGHVSKKPFVAWYYADANLAISREVKHCYKLYASVAASGINLMKASMDEKLNLVMTLKTTIDRARYIIDNANLYCYLITDCGWKPDYIWEILNSEVKDEIAKTVIENGTKDMKVREAILLLCVVFAPVVAEAQVPVRDNEKKKQWQSMENGPWDFAPDWYYYFLHKGYSGAEMYWKWAGFKSGFRVRFKESKSNIKRIMPTRVISEETQRQKLEKVEEERRYVEELYKEELVREADRTVDLAYPAYKDEFNRMQDCITDGLLYCMTKSGGKLKPQVDELGRQNEILCADIAYIRKTGVGYGLENAKRQQAYEEAKGKMETLVKQTANLCAVAATHY